MDSIKFIFAVLLRKKIFVVSGGLLGFVLTSCFLALVPPKYTSSMLIASSTHGGSSLSDSSSRGLSIGSALLGNIQNPDFTRVLALMHSETVAARLQERYAVLQQLYPSRWNAEQGRWTKPSGPLSRLSQWVNRWFGRPEWVPPDPQTLAEAFAKDIHIDASENKGIFRVSYTAKTPQLAALIVDKAYQEAEAVARIDSLRTTNAYVQYLDDELKRVTQQSARQGLMEIYTQQQQRKMLLSADVPFAADVISAPTIPDKPTGLNPLVMLFIGTVAGVAGISTVILIFARYRSQRGDNAIAGSFDAEVGHDDYERARNYN